MTLLESVEKSVGNEYFDEDNYSELHLAKLYAKHNITSDQSKQPNANKIVMIN